MHPKVLFLITSSAALALAIPRPQPQTTQAAAGGFLSGQPAQNCAINPPDAEGDNVCYSDGNQNTSICCPAGSGCVQSCVSWFSFCR